MRIGIIGAGNVGAMYATRWSPYNEIVIYEKDRAKLEQLDNDCGCEIAESIEEVARACEIILLAVKPANVIEAIKALSGHGKIIISTVAAVEETAYYQAVGEFPLFRIMPTMVNKTGGPIMAVRGKYASDKDWSTVRKLLKEVGTSYLISEEQMNAYMCVMSCSPAVVAEMFRQYVDSFCALTGIDSEKSLDTLLDMVEHLVPIMRSERSDIIPQVCTPGGITEVGVRYISEQKQFFVDLAQAMLNRTHEICASVNESL